jgi:rhodanese-related sulfurtransferase/predicted methyltransferase
MQMLLRTVTTFVLATSVAAAQDVRRVNTADLRALFDSGQLVALDVRDPASFQRGRVPGAILFKWDEVDALAATLKRDGKPVVAYCDCPAEESSLSAAAALRKAGFDGVSVLVGGFAKWKADGHPVAAGPAPGATAAKDPHDGTPREQWQRVDDIFRELGVAAGTHVADIGAGGGFFTTRLAKAVGPEGRVYAVDVNPVSLRELKAALGDGAANVEVIRGDEDDPRLPSDRLDAALVVNAYHEFAEHRAMLAKMLAALKPGGRLAIVEPAPTRASDTTRAAQEKRHTIAIEFVEEDLRQAGFEIVVKNVAFTTRPDHEHRSNGAAETIEPVEWLLVARRPAK